MRANCIVISVVVLTLTSISLQPLIAQTDSAAVGANQPSAEASAAESNIRFSVESSSRFGIPTYVPEHWGELHLRLENSAIAPKELLCVSYFGQQTTLQFGRQFWVPARARLNIQHPVLLPKADQFSDHVAEIHSLVFDRSSGNEVLLKNDSGQIRHDQSLIVAPALRNTGVFAGWSSTDSVPQDVLDLLIAGRVNQGLRNSVTVLSGHFLPADESSLSYLDHIVIAENRLIDDAAALAALRRWVHAGGRLWIMLDRTDPILVERLLGDDFYGTVVDHVGLSAVKIDKAASLLAPNGEQGKAIDYENPVDMARVIVSGMQVRNSVDGWPVAMTASYGEGRILMTTLGARGWMQPTPPPREGESDERPLYLKSLFVPLSPMEDLAAYIFSNRDPEPMLQSDLESLTQEFVSYKIPSWTTVIGIMCCFLTLLTAIGIWLWRTERLEHFGWIGSLVAVVFGGLFIGLGIANRYGVSETIASVQIAQVVDGSDDVRTQGMIAVYRSEGNSSPVQTTHSGKLQLDMTGIEGTTCRMVTTDLGAFHWEGFTQLPGLRMYPDATSRSFNDRIAANATFDSNGIHGQFTGLAASTTDAVLATRHGRIGVTLAKDGKFVALASDHMGPDQFLNVAFLGDVQDRRRRILKQLFNNHSWKDSLTQPHLLLWSNDWDTGFQFGEGLEHQGETLLTIPVELAPPEAGTKMVIPSALISYAACMAPDGSLPTGFWDDLRGEWQERSSPSTTWLSFQVPRSILPLQATKARIDVKVSGAMGQLEFLGVKDGVEVQILSVTNPVGSLSFEIDDPSVLSLSMNGELSLGVRAGMMEDTTKQANFDPMSATAKTYWRIESLSLQLWAVTTNLPAED